MIVAIVILFFVQILLISAKTAGFINILIKRALIAINFVLMMALSLDFLRIRFHPTYILLIMGVAIIFFVLPHIVQHIYNQVTGLERRRILLSQKALLRQSREVVEFHKN